MILFKAETEHGTIQSISASAILDAFMLMEAKSLSYVDNAEHPIFIEKEGKKND